MFYWVRCRSGLKGTVIKLDKRGVIGLVWDLLGEEVVEYQPLSSPVSPVIIGIGGAL